MGGEPSQQAVDKTRPVNGTASNRIGGHRVNGEQEGEEHKAGTRERRHGGHQSQQGSDGNAFLPDYAPGPTVATSNRAGGTIHERPQIIATVSNTPPKKHGRSELLETSVTGFSIAATVSNRRVA